MSKSYKEKFLAFCRALEVEKPEEFIENDIDIISMVGRTIVIQITNPEISEREAIRQAFKEATDG